MSSFSGEHYTHKFTGYERDTESGLDYANARYYNSGLGRFMSVDPAKGDTASPQSYNRYAYVQNNPLAATDPSGAFSLFALRNPCGAAQLADEEGIPIDSFSDFGFGDESSDFDWTDSGNILGRDRSCMELVIWLSAVAIAKAAQQEQNPTTFRLDLGSDCLDGNGRFLDYSLKTDAGGNPLGSYTISEHLKYGTPRGPSPKPNEFDDFLVAPGVLVGQSFKDEQTFTINGPGANNLPVTIRMYGKDYGTNGLFEKVTGQALPLIIVNGTTAPQQRPGGYCPDDPFRKPVGVGGIGGRRPLSLIIRPVRRLAY